MSFNAGGRGTQQQATPFGSAVSFFQGDPPAFASDPRLYHRFFQMLGLDGTEPIDQQLWIINHAIWSNMIPPSGVSMQGPPLPGPNNPSYGSTSRSTYGAGPLHVANQQNMGYGDSNSSGVYAERYSSNPFSPAQTHPAAPTGQLEDFPSGFTYRDAQPNPFTALSSSALPSLPRLGSDRRSMGYPSNVSDSGNYEVNRTFAQTRSPYDDDYSHPSTPLVSKEEVTEALSSIKSEPPRKTGNIQKPSTMEAFGQQSLSIGVVQDSSTSNESSGLVEKMLKFPRTTAELQADQIVLQYGSVADARANVLKQRLASNSAQDLAIFKAQYREKVWTIMRAIDSHQYLKPQSKARHDLDDDEKDAWNSWQLNAHTTAREVLDKDTQHTHLEKQAWEIYEAIRVIHEGECRVYTVKLDPMASCLDRLQAVISCLEEYAIVRERAVIGMKAKEFVANPYAYVKSRVANMWNNNRKKKGIEEATQATKKGEKRSVDDAAIGEQEDEAEAVTQTPKKKAKESSQFITPIQTADEQSEAWKERAKGTPKRKYVVAKADSPDK